MRMIMIRLITAGESHGRCLTAIIEGLPSGIPVCSDAIDSDLARRQGGYGRGGRMKIEKDRAEIIAGVRHGKTLGSPLAMLIQNKDWENWRHVMSPDAYVNDDASVSRAVTRPRPGHADLAAGLKYDQTDLRNILERSSARETAARVAGGAVLKGLLEAFGMRIYSFVVEIGGVKWAGAMQGGFKDFFKMAEASDVRCPDKDTGERMKRRIDAARKAGDSVGGVFVVVVTGVPPGLGSHTQWERKLDGRLARALMSIHAIKGVETGIGFKAGSLSGSKVHDEIFYKKGRTADAKGFWPQYPRFYRKTNNAGGIEGGTSNGEPIIFRAVMKPIPTLYKPLRSVDIKTKKAFSASIERSDVCAVPAAAVVAEAATALEIADAFLEKTGGDGVKEIERNYRGYLKQVRDF